jgi:nitric oxide reductase NorE protein
MTDVAPTPAIAGNVRDLPADRTDKNGRETRVPGEPAIWFFVIGDIWIFSCYFATYLYDRGRHHAAFLQAQRHLSQGRGVANTLLLLTSSLLVALGVEAARAGRRENASRLVFFAGLCGAGFLVVKGLEWAPFLRDDLNISTNQFFMYYYMLTALHIVHVILGLGILTHTYRTLRRSPTPPVALTETAATFWHMVDLLWIIIFALLYLMR